MVITPYRISVTFPRMSEERGPVPRSFSIPGLRGGGGGKNGREIPSSTLTQYSAIFRNTGLKFFPPYGEAGQGLVCRLVSGGSE